MTPSPEREPQIRCESLTVDEYDVLTISLSDAQGQVAVLTYDRLADKEPVLTLVAGAATVTLSV